MQVKKVTLCTIKRMVRACAQLQKTKIFARHLVENATLTYTQP
jgi:hypothetical protein